MISSLFVIRLNSRNDKSNSFSSTTKVTPPAWLMSYNLFLLTMALSVQFRETLLSYKFGNNKTRDSLPCDRCVDRALSCILCCVYNCSRSRPPQ